MANQELYDKRYQIPPDVIRHVSGMLVSYPTEEGKNRAKNIVNNKYLTYQAMKKLKHEMNSMEKPGIQYELAGGNRMEMFIDRTLNQDRAGVQRSKEAKRDVASPPVTDLRAFQTPRLNEAKEELKKNAVGVIVNSDNKILLLKRSDYPDQWMPDKWALVGGGIEKKEKPEEACKREIKEETGLEIDDFVESFTIQRHKDSEETIFACRYEGEDTDVDLDMKENVKYGWYDVSEMEYLDTVPHLIEYITLVFKKYD